MISRKIWSNEEDIYLKDNYLNLGVKEIAEKLNRTTISVRSRVAILKIHKYGKHNIQIGEIYNRLKIIAKSTTKDSNNKYRFICECICGNIIEVAGKFLATGHTKSCGCLSINVAMERRLPKGISSYNYLYQVCKANAKKREIDFSLSYDEHTTLIQNLCFHCGRSPEKFNRYSVNSKISQITKDNSEVFVHGVDRLNSDLSYILNNCVSCCTSCNIAKSSLTLKEFQEDNERRYYHQQKNKNGNHS